MVINASKSVAAADNKNSHQLKETRYAKACSHLFIKNHEIGIAITHAIKTIFKNEADSKPAIFDTDAPNTFRIPISFIRCSVASVVKANRPRLDINMAIKAA